MIDERKSKFIDLLIEGNTNKTDIAKLIGVSRQCLYDWLDDPQVKAELDTRLQAIRNDCTKKFNAKLEPVIDELYKIALTGTDVRTRSLACQYLINRVLGSPTANTNITDERKTEDNIDVLSAFEEVNKEENNE